MSKAIKTAEYADLLLRRAEGIFTNVALAGTKDDFEDIEQWLVEMREITYSSHTSILVEPIEQLRGAQR